MRSAEMAKGTLISCSQRFEAGVARRASEVTTMRPLASERRGCEGLAVPKLAVRDLKDGCTDGVLGDDVGGRWIE